VRVAIVESCEVYRRGLVAVLTEADMTVVATRASLEGLRQPPADVVVVDADSAVEPDLDEEIGRIADAAPVVLLTSAENGWPAGVAGLVNRPVTIDALLAAIHAAAGGTSPSTDEGQASVGTRLLDDALTPDRGILSQREYEVIRQIAEGRTQSQIARALGISHHTVDSYLRRIRAKLGLGNKAELTRAAMLGHLDPGRDMN